LKTLVLDDDPTGTQSATGVPVLLEVGTEIGHGAGYGAGYGADAEGGDAAASGALADRIHRALRRDDALYVLTNSRSIGEAEAVALARRVREAALEAAARLGERVRFVLRGDSTLRGHVFAESDVFATPDSVLLFLPAFPAGGRTTRGGVHYVRTGGADVPAAETEYADDPVFGFRSSELRSYVAEQGGGRKASTVPLDELRERGGEAVAAALGGAAPGTVVAPDAVTDADVDLVYAGLQWAWEAGRDVVVRCAAPLAARCARATSTGLLPRPLERPAGPVLVVCGSHTAGATAQLAALEREFGLHPVVLDTGAALADPAAAGRALVGPAGERLRSRGVAVLASERHRRASDGTLDHGERVMSALTTAVRALVAGADDGRAGDPASGVPVGAVIAKGGITSAEVARTGLGARSARVRGQLLPGVSVWDLPLGVPPERSPAADGAVLPYVVVPGNVGDETALVEALRRLGA